MGRPKRHSEITKRPIEDFMCQNDECNDFGKRNNGNLKFEGWSSKPKGIRMIRCKTCNARFSERKGTPLFRSQIDEGDATNVLNHLREGVGMRATARLVEVHRDTVGRLAKMVGEHSQCLHDELVDKSPETREIQMDEKWSYVKMKQKNVPDDQRNSEELGDRWDHVAIDAESKLVLKTIPGKRTDEKCAELVADVKKRTNNREDILFTSDEHEGYEKAILRNYGKKNERKIENTIKDS